LSVLTAGACRLDVDQSLTRWKHQDEAIPRSVCSEPCPAGHVRKVKGVQRSRASTAAGSASSVASTRSSPMTSVVWRARMEHSRRFHRRGTSASRCPWTTCHSTATSGGVLTWSSCHLVQYLPTWSSTCRWITCHLAATGRVLDGGVTI